MSWIPPGPIDHVGVAVRDLDTACATYRTLLGARLEQREVVAGQGIEAVFLALPGGTRVELVAPLDDSGPLARSIERRGEGLHHICVLVDDIEATLARLAEHDVPVVDARARAGAEGARIAFLHPAALGGVLLELKEERR